MSALVLVRRDPYARGHFLACQTGCIASPTGGGGRRDATHMAFIAGHPAGGLCTSCARTWRDTWDSLSGNGKETA